MTTTITHPGGTITPLLVDGYSATRASRNLEHVILGRSSSDFTLRPAALRRGELKMLFALESDAADAVTALSTPDTYTLVTDARTTLNMDFVVLDGGCQLALDEQTRDMWVVTVPFQEFT